MSQDAWWAERESWLPLLPVRPQNPRQAWSTQSLEREKRDLRELLNPNVRKDIPEIRPGDTVSVKFRTLEAGRERSQTFQGVVIRKRPINFTARQVFHGVGVERTFPLNSPLLEEVKVLQQGRVRRAKLYYLRGLSGRKTRAKIRAK